MADEKDDQVENGATGDDVDDGAEQPPLALGLNGDPIDVPDEAVGWRVSWRKLGERGGSPSLVYANGRPLILPLEATAEELVEQVGGKSGRYRLDPVDERQRVIKDSAPAYAVIEKPIGVTSLAAPGAAGRSGVDDGALREMMGETMAAVKHVVQSLENAFTTQSQQMANVLQACAQNVAPASRVIRELEQVPVSVEEAPRREFSWKELLAGMLPTFLAQFGPQLAPLVGAFAKASIPIVEGMSGPRLPIPSGDEPQGGF